MVQVISSTFMVIFSINLYVRNLKVGGAFEFTIGKTKNFLKNSTFSE